MEEGEGKRVILFPLPFPGHFNPMIQLAGIFHRRGFSVTVLHTSLNSPDVSLHPKFTFRFLREEDPPIQPKGSRLDIVALLRQLDDRCAAPFRESLSSELAVAEGCERVVCLVSDSLWGFTGAVADEVGVRRMVLRTGGATSFCAFAAFPLLRDEGYLPIKNSRLDEVLPGLQPLKVKDLPVIETNEPEGIYRLVKNNMLNGVESSSGVILNTFEDLEGSSLANLRHQLRVPIFPIGPFHKHGDDLPPTKDDDSITSWLDKQEPKSVVYVSFGSIAAIDEKEFLEIAWGLSNSAQRFLWVVRPGSVRGTEWLETLPCGFMENVGEKGKIAKWVNQCTVLKHRAIAAFWTHCGWNSTLESICEGVPMICTPFFSDQHADARYVCDVWKIGVPLERKEIDRREVEKVIRRMMVEEQADEMREKGLKLKDKANLCVRQDGSSYKSLDNLISHVLSFDSFAYKK